MSLKALRRLSETELSGLRVALDAIASTESFLIARLDRMRRAANREAKVRRLMGLPGPGEFDMAYVTVLEVVRKLTVAREETMVTIERGKIRRTG